MGVLDLIFPKSCLGCGKTGVYICPDCVAKVRLAKPICPYCERASIDGLTHAKCTRENGLDGLASIWEYEGVIRRAILALKYKYSLEVGRELSEVFIEYLQNSKFLIPPSGVLVPIPIHWYRENFRGFNKSDLIGQGLAKEMGWKFAPDLLIKNKHTVAQAELKGNDRRKNLKGTFAVNPAHIPYTIPNILLFDDVFTTGSTLMEAAKTLKKGGVKKVWGLTICR